MTVVLPNLQQSPLLLWANFVMYKYRREKCCQKQGQKKRKKEEDEEKSTLTENPYYESQQKAKMDKT